MHQKSPMHFGERLRQKRLQCHLSQEALAEALKVAPRSIQRWEAGQSIPQAFYRLQLSHFFHVSPQDLFEGEEQQEPPLSPLPRFWSLPFPRNPYFIGREDILNKVYQQLSPYQTARVNQPYSFYGLGGVGKTQLVIEYAYRHALEYEAIFWIGAESVDTITTSYLTIAELLKLPECREADQQRILAAVRHWLSTHSQWLVIWDNLEDLELFLRFRPSVYLGTLLITTQRSALGSLAQGIELLPMTQEEGVLLLLRRAKVMNVSVAEEIAQFARCLPREYEAAQELVKVLDGLPLALDQVGAYVEETGCSLADYLNRYEIQYAELLARRGTFSGDHPYSVTTTFKLICQRVEHVSLAATELLRLCAFLHAEAIPEALFLTHTFPYGPLVADPLQLDLAIALLRSFSLVQRQTQEQTLSLHRLVQVILRDSMSRQEQAEFQKRAICILNATFPDIGYDVWQLEAVRQCERLLPHVLACTANTPDQGEDQERADMLRKAADYLRERSEYEQAESLAQRALRIMTQALGPEQSQVAYPLYSLGFIYYRQGKHELSELFYRRALHIWEQTLGAEHPQVAFAFNGLGLLFSEQGKNQQAEEAYRRALSIREQTLGAEHPRVAAALNNLGFLFSKQGRYQQAEQVSQRALHIWEQTLGAEHPDLAYALTNLGFLFSKQGGYQQAEQMYQRALRIRERVFGAQHHHVAYLLCSLAALYSEQGRYKEAKPLLYDACSTLEHCLGPAHPETVKALQAYRLLIEREGNKRDAQIIPEAACNKDMDKENRSK